MIRVKDLKPRPAPNELLHCVVCGGEYSANIADYFAANPETVLRCENGHAPRNLNLAIKRTVYEPIYAEA